MLRTLTVDRTPGHWHGAGLASLILILNEGRARGHGECNATYAMPRSGQVRSGQDWGPA